MDDVNGLMVKYVTWDVVSEIDVYDQPTRDVTDNGNTADEKYLKRIDTQDSVELNESYSSSPIFVRHPNEDQDHGDPLGGFLCTASREHGTFVHAFSTLDDTGILAKCLQVREKDIFVRLNSTQISDSELLTHEEVLEIFAKLPLGRPNIMIVYNRKSEKFKRIEFQLEDITGVIVKEKSGMLMAKPSKVIAFQLPNEPKFLVIHNGQLSFNQTEDFSRDCSCHFIVNKELDEDHRYPVYRYQAQKDTTKFLGIKGNTLGLVDVSGNKKSTLFRKEKNQHGILLIPRAQEDNFVQWAHSGCDCSTGDAYSSKAAPDSTSGVQGFMFVQLFVFYFGLDRLINFVIFAFL